MGNLLLPNNLSGGVWDRFQLADLDANNDYVPLGIEDNFTDRSIGQTVNPRRWWVFDSPAVTTTYVPDVVDKGGVNAGKWYVDQQDSVERCMGAFPYHYPNAASGTNLFYEIGNVFDLRFKFIDFNFQVPAPPPVGTFGDGVTIETIVYLDESFSYGFLVGHQHILSGSVGAPNNAYVIYHSTKTGGNWSTPATIDYPASLIKFSTPRYLRFARNGSVFSCQDSADNITYPEHVSFSVNNAGFNTTTCYILVTMYQNINLSQEAWIEKIWLESGNKFSKYFYYESPIIDFGGNFLNYAIVDAVGNKNITTEYISSDNQPSGSADGTVTDNDGVTHNYWDFDNTWTNNGYIEGNKDYTNTNQGQYGQVKITGTNPDQSVETALILKKFIMNYGANMKIEYGESFGSSYTFDRNPDFTDFIAVIDRQIAEGRTIDGSVKLIASDSANDKEIYKLKFPNITASQKNSLKTIYDGTRSTGAVNRKIRYYANESVAPATYIEGYILNTWQEEKLILDRYNVSFEIREE